MVIMTSAETGSGIALLRQTLEGRVSALVGPSGVGKSSLICAVSPGVDLDTSEISSSTGKGRHTTTCSRLIKLDGGGYVADTPGMREFGFHQISRDELAWCFREFRPHTESCRFADCHHVKEPGCGVREAVEQGLVSPGRYEHYLRLMGGVSQSNRLVVC
jgi:ribosome biogenesis GTPase